MTNEKNFPARIVIDLDGTLTIDDPERSYAEKEPNQFVIQKLREYKSKGTLIVILTARNMRTYAGNTGKINIFTLPVIIDWLNTHDVPYDEIHVGKPWCGSDGFYVDDKAIRPSEFARLSYLDIRSILDSEGKSNGGD